MTRYRTLTAVWTAWAVGIVGFFGPWVFYEASALQRSGYELAEFVKFFPEVQSGKTAITRELFLTPLVGAGVLLSLLGYGTFKSSVLRLVTHGLAAAVVLAALPPYQSIVEADYRGRLVLVGCGLVFTLLPACRLRLSTQTRGAFTVAACALAVCPALTEYLALRRFVANLYGHPPGVGWGLVACTVGYAGVAVCTVVTRGGSCRRMA